MLWRKYFGMGANSIDSKRAFQIDLEADFGDQLLTILSKPTEAVHNL
jgi:hypothetical protein